MMSGAYGPMAGAVAPGVGATEGMGATPGAGVVAGAGAGGASTGDISGLIQAYVF